MARQARAKQKYPESSQGTRLVEGKAIRLRFQPTPQSESQRFYLEALENSKLTIGTGPAGSGKSFLAMSVAVKKLLAKEVQKIVITRPIVEAGEKLGFLPGTFEEKISPYLLPLLDALDDLVGPTMAKKLLENGQIEFAPLAYMRGRTFNNCFVILDEAQNTTIEQMKLFVTRIGNYSQFVVNGDASQTDLDRSKFPETGLEWISRRLRGVSSDIQVVQFTTSDIVRSEIVKTILTYLDGPDDQPRPRKERHSFHEERTSARGGALLGG
jgi:phosphate starvation-inducible protein PhoH and related proteins